MKEWMNGGRRSRECMNLRSSAPQTALLRRLLCSAISSSRISVNSSGLPLGFRKSLKLPLHSITYILCFLSYTHTHALLSFLHPYTLCFLSYIHTYSFSAFLCWNEGICWNGIAPTFCHDPTLVQTQAFYLANGPDGVVISTVLRHETLSYKPSSFL